jgi:signal transduction histidine kinase
MAEYNSRDYSGIFFPVWNAFVRFSIFIAIGLLLFNIKNKQKELNLANSKLIQMNEEKNKFIGIAAHDLRNPIGGICSFSEALLVNYKNSVHPEVVEYLEYIKELSNNALRILAHLLDISLIESGKIDLKLEPQDYITFIKQQIKVNQLLATHKHIAIRFNSEINGIIMNFDKHYMGEVIDNLLSNAIKYSNQNSKIDVNISITNNDNLLTEIIDKGKGIPEAEQNKLFSYFQTTSTKPTAGEQSTGLGLAISKQIVTFHKGVIAVKSAPEKGSNFYFTLPIGYNYAN